MGNGVTDLGSGCCQRLSCCLELSERQATVPFIRCKSQDRIWDLLTINTERIIELHYEMSITVLE